MIGLANEIGDIREHISFIDIRDNFGKAAKFGIDSKFTWFNDSKINHTNGARWMLRSYTKLKEEATTDVALSALTHDILNKQTGAHTPVHLWPLTELKDFTHYNFKELTVADVMMTDLFTVQKDDVIELVAEIMKWRNIKYTPVEDTKGKLAGLVSSKELSAFLQKTKNNTEEADCFVEDIMIKDTITVEGEVKVDDAIKLMKEHDISCLPVVKGEELIGIVTGWDINNLSDQLLS